MPVQAIPVAVVFGAAAVFVGFCGFVIFLKNKYEERFQNQVINVIINRPTICAPWPSPSASVKVRKYTTMNRNRLCPATPVKEIPNATVDEVSYQTKVENWVVDLPNEASNDRTSVATEELDSSSKTLTCTTVTSSNSELRRRQKTLCQLCGNRICTVGKITMDCGHKFHLDCVTKVHLKNRMCPKCRSDKCCTCGELCTNSYLKLDCEHVYHLACRTQYELLMHTCSICRPETAGTDSDNSDDQTGIYKQLQFC